MTRIAIRHWLVVVLLAASAAGCAGTSGSKSKTVVERPPTQGLYVVYNGKMGRLDDAPDKVLKTWPIRSNLGSNLEFVIYHPAIADSAGSAGQLVSLRQVAYVRANIAASGTVHTNKKAEWIVASLDPLNVPARVMQDSKDPTLLRVVPNEPLTPGLYALTLRTGNTVVTGRFGVEWGKSDKKQYASTHCVDRYLHDARAVPAVRRARLRRRRRPQGSGAERQQGDRQQRAGAGDRGPREEHIGQTPDVAAHARRPQRQAGQGDPALDVHNGRQGAVARDVGGVPDDRGGAAAQYRRRGHPPRRVGQAALRPCREASSRACLTGLASTQYDIALDCPLLAV